MDRPRVLIVDDEIIIARELETRLRSLGYEVVGLASSGGEAVRVASETKPDLILMDIVLKGEMDGIDAAGEIRRLCHAPVIYLTAHTDRRTLERAKVTEPFGYIVKPFSERELEANIEMALYKHRMETRLRRVERWLAESGSAGPRGIIHADEEGRITSFDTAAQAITAWDREQALGRPMEEVIRIRHGHAREAESFAELAEGPVVALAEDTVLLDRHDESIPVDYASTLIRDEHQRPLGRVTLLRDATGQRHGAVLALRNDVALAVSQAVSLKGMLQLCAESMVNNLGAAFARIWTLDDAEQMLHLQASAGLYRNLEGAHALVPVGELKIGLIAQHGTPLFTNDVLNDPRITDPAWARREGMVSFAGHPLVVEERVVGVMAVFARRALPYEIIEVLESVSRTIAVGVERRRAEEALRSARARLEQVICSSPAVTYVLSMGIGGIAPVWISENIQEMLGYTAAEVRRPSWWLEKIHPDDRREAYGQTEELMRMERSGSGHGGNRVVRDYRFLHRDGTYRWIRDEQRLSTSAETGETEVVGSWSDITEHRELEQQYLQSQKMEAIGQLAGGVAHDFNNLLTIISGYGQMALRQSGLSETARTLVGEIVKAGERASSLTRQLLVFSRKEVVTPEVLKLDALVADMEEMLRRLIGEEIDLVVSLEAPQAHVNADPGQLQQVVMNLAVNARDAMPHGGTLAIRTASVNLTEAAVGSDLPAQGPHVMLEVSDTGIGIDPGLLERIFEPFFTTKEQGKGTGLGLATVYGIVRQNRGQISVQSAPGEGTSIQGRSSQGGCGG